MPHELLICVNQRMNAISCAGRGSNEIADALDEGIKQRGLNVQLIRIQCFGRCNNGPVLRIVGQSFHHRTQLSDVPALLEQLELFMSEQKTPPIYTRLGVKPVINGCGVYTDLGGSRLSPRVWEAMEQVNRSFVDLPDLLDKAGLRVASLLGAEAGIITPGAAAAIMLGSAAAMAGTDGEVSQRLPDTTGLKRKVLIQSGHRYKYDRQVSMTGAQLVEVGSENGTRTEQIEEAVDDATAMILYPAHLASKAGSVSISEVSKVARAHNVPLFVDAAFMNYPTDVLQGLIDQGADLVAVSAKYFGGPNAGGFIMGRTDLIEAVRNVYFTRYESGAYLKYGRPLKMDRHTVVAVVVALEDWLERDHEERLRSWKLRGELLCDGLQGLSGINARPMCFTLDERIVPEPVNCVTLNFDSATPLTATKLAQALKDEDPQILTIPEGDVLIVAIDEMTDAEARYVASRIASAASG